MIRRVLFLMLLVSTRAVAAEPATSVPVRPAPSKEAEVSITYLTVSTVYLSAGRRDGLKEGDRLSVIRGDRVLGTLQVDNLSSRRASCKILDSIDEINVGDRIAWADRTAGEAPVLLKLSQQRPSFGLVSPVSGGNARDWLRARGFRGRVSGRYLTVQDRSGTGQSFSQPAIDARIEGRNIDGSSYDLSVDVRARRTFRQESDGTTSHEGRSRVYRANATWKGLASRLSLAVGRQYSPELSSLSIFDGVSLVLRTERVSVGLLSGSQPDPATFGYSGETREHGVFVQARSSPGSTTKLNATIGIIGSYTSGEINHEYLTVQTHYSGGKAAIYFAQDIDLNRGWKREVEGKSLSLNNTYSSLRYQVAQKTTLSAGLDNRRTIRLYRDYVSPEVEFDDTFRQGVWAGVSHRIAKSYRLGARVKRSTGGSSGSANTYTFSGAIRWRMDLHGRTTRFDNDLLSGWIHSGSASVNLGPRTRFEIGGGLRTQRSRTSVGGDDRLTWTSVMADYSLGRSWYASLSVERSRQGADANDQVVSMLNYRF